MSQAFVLLFHGSRSAGALEFERDLAAAVRARGAEHYLPHVAAEVAHLGSTPTLDDAIDACVKKGARCIVVVPMFLVPGAHAEGDVPKLCAAARARFPEVTLLVSELVGRHPALADAVLALLRATPSS